MFIGRQHVFRVIGFACLNLLFLSCSEVNDNARGNMKDGYTFYSDGIAITAKALESNKSSDLSVLFDGKHNGVWSPHNSTCETDIDYVFSEPVYIKEIILRNGYPPDHGAFEKHNRAKNISILTFKNEEDVSFNDGFTITLKDTKDDQHILLSQSHFSTILRPKALSIRINDCYEGTSKEVVGIRGITFKFTDKPAFTPSLPVNEIKNRFGANIKKWSIKPLSEDDPLVDEVMSNLMWEGLNGNSVAERLFYSYSPHGAATGEMHSYLVSWYKLTKAINKAKL